MRVVVTGMGAQSVFGAGVAALWNGVVAGNTGTERASDARAAIDDALAQARLAARDTAFVWGTGLDTYASGDLYVSAGATFAELAARHAAPTRMVAVACATGTAAVGDALRLVRAGRARAIVAGGSSVMRTPYYLTGFAALGALAKTRCAPFDIARDGFVLTDGAGALVIESEESARARDATPLAEVIGYGASQDAFDLNRPPEDGAGAERAIRRAMQDGGVTAIDAVNAHGTGTVAGDLAEAAALARVVPGVPVSSAKGAIGHAMAAAGALEAIVAIETLRTGTIPPTAHLAHLDPRCPIDAVHGAPRALDVRTVLSTSFGMGGQNAALILRRFS